MAPVFRVGLGLKRVHPFLRQTAQNICLIGLRVAPSRGLFSKFCIPPPSFQTAEAVVRMNRILCQRVI